MKKSYSFILVLILIAGLLCSCHINKVSGDGNVVSKEIPIKDYDEIQIEGENVDFKYMQSDDVPYLKVETDQNIMDLLDINTDSKVLVVRPKNRHTGINPTRFIVITNSVEAAPRKERKTTQEKFDKELEALNEKLTVAKDAVWLTEKFGEGVYQDIPGLCKVASRDTILNEKGASLTPGAYVGAAPVEDDGVDFAQRMKEIHKELLELQAESNRLMETISKNLEEMGL